MNDSSRNGATSDTPHNSLEMSVTVDHSARVVQVGQRKPLDIRPQTVLLPFDLVKALYLQILMTEVPPSMLPQAPSIGRPQ